MSIADTAKEVAGWTAIAIAAPVSVAIAWKSAKAIGRRIRDSVANEANTQASIDDLEAQADASHAQIRTILSEENEKNRDDAKPAPDQAGPNIIHPQIPQWTNSAG